MKEIPEFIQALPGFAALLSQLEEAGDQAPLGLNRAARLPVLAALHQTTGRPILLITQKSDRALTLADELALWAPQATRLYFPEPTSLFYENVPWGENTRRERILALTSLAAGLIPGAPRPPTPPIVISPARALMTRILPRREFLKAARTLRPGQQIDPVSLAHTLAANGYEATDTVVLPGQFARRGGLLDLWPVAEKLPTRLDFFGDEIESMRSFDPATQRSNGKIEKLLVPPAREFLVDPEMPLPDDELGWTEFHIPLLHNAPASLLDYLPQKALVLMDDWEAFRQIMDDLETQAVGLHRDYLADGSIRRGLPPALPHTERDRRFALPAPDAGVGTLRAGRMPPNWQLTSHPTRVSAASSTRWSTIYSANVRARRPGGGRLATRRCACRSCGCSRTKPAVRHPTSTAAAWPKAGC